MRPLFAVVFALLSGGRGLRLFLDGRLRAMPYASATSAASPESATQPCLGIACAIFLKQDPIHRAGRHIAEIQITLFGLLPN
jgi:hypothetical protein